MQFSVCGGGGDLCVYVIRGADSVRGVRRRTPLTGGRVSISYIIVNFSNRRLGMLLMGQVKRRGNRVCRSVGLPKDLVCVSRSLSRTTRHMLYRLANVGGMGLVRFGTFNSGGEADGPGSMR